MRFINNYFPWHIFTEILQYLGRCLFYFDKSILTTTFNFDRTLI